MKLRIRKRQPKKAEALVIPLLQDAPPPADCAAAGEAAAFTGRAGEACEVFTTEGRRLLVGLGPVADPAAAEAAGALAAARLSRLRRIALDGRSLSAAAAASFAAGAMLRAWHDDRLRTQPDETLPRLRKFTLIRAGRDTAAAWRQVAAGVAGTLFARRLVTEPANTLTPAGFIRRLRRVERAGAELEVLKPKALSRAGFGALLAVGGASVHRPRLAVLRWAGEGGPPVAFVGKGITFDTGGVCVKPAEGMWEMRADMAGAAAAAGAILALARRRSPAAAVAVLPLAENAIGAASYRPGDVLRSYSGTTIEVIDTDAEGRLVLADALAWTVAELRPRAIVDLATLTGSTVVALGEHMAGMFDNDAALAASVAAAAAAVAEPVWRMPIGETHRAALDSEIADLRHCAPGRMQPDACQAAAFLREFVGDTPWVHLDIAGVESRREADDRQAAGASGFGVRLLDRLVAARFETAT